MPKKRAVLDHLKRDELLAAVERFELTVDEDFNFYSGEPDPRWLVEPGELLFARAGSREASFGPCLWPEPRGVLNQYIHRIELQGVAKEYLYLLLRFLTTEARRGPTASSSLWFT